MAQRATPGVERMPLSLGFRFIHEPLGTSDEREWSRFVGRSSELDDLVSRIVLSNGGAFLLTGYRGVGKTTFVNRVIHEVRLRLPKAESLVGVSRVVDVSFNFARPLKPVELLYHILRGLHRRLAELDILPHLDPALRRDLELACARTSASVAVGHDAEIQQQVGGDFSLGLPWARLPVPLKLQRTWKSVSRHDMTYLAYDEKAAEHDLISIAQRLTRGFTERRGWRPAWWSRTPPRRVRLKVLMVFDELDKLDEARGPEERSPLDRVLSTLKNLFTTSGIAFVFVAGKDLHERWLEDLSKGDSIYESVFAHAQYLSGMWSDAELLCDSLVGDDVASGRAALPNTAYSAFRKYLAFKGRGIARRTVRGFNEFVRWDEDVPCLQFAPSDLRRFRFYAGLLDTLVHAEEELLGRFRGEGSVERLDKRRLGLYYATDWILQREQQEFTLENLVEASRRMSRVIAPVEEAAPVELQRLLDVLVRGEYVESVESGGTAVLAGASVGPRPVRYRLPRRRLLELGAFLGVFEQESQALFKDETLTQLTPRPQEPAGGELIGGRYQVVAKIGEGGMARVFRARDLRTGAEVAVKQLSPYLLEDASVRLRAVREGHLLGSFNHPGIVRVVDALDDGALVAVVMEYVQGPSLTDVLRHGRVTDPAVAARVMADIADAVAYIHTRGVVWRDPKPGNIVISPAGRVVIMDFGIARAATPDGDTHTGVVIGTPSYMSPEQARGEAVDGRSDIFGMGAVFFELVTGKRLFSGNSMADVVMMVTAASVPRPSSVVPDAAIFDELIGRCLARTPADRITASELREALVGLAAPSAAVAAYLSGLEQRGASREESDTVLVAPTVALTSVARPPTSVVGSPGVARPGGAVTPVPAGAGVWKGRGRRAAPPPPPQARPVTPPPLPVPPAAPPPAWTSVSSPAPAGEDAPGTALMEPRLEIQGTGRIVPLSPVTHCRIGRSADNDIVLDDVAASRYAAEIRRGDTIVASESLPYYIEDLNSANGVLVNGKRISGAARLADGDVIAIGSTSLRFRER